MVPEDVIGCCYDWGVDGVDFFGTPEVEGCVVPWEVNGCLVAGGISQDASVDAKFCVLVALFVSPLSNSVVGVKLKWLYNSKKKKKVYFRLQKRDKNT